MSEPTFRLVQHDDYPSLAALYSLVYPHDTHSTEEFRYLDASNQRPPFLFKRFVALVDGIIVGTGRYSQYAGMYHPQRFLIKVFVHPDYRRRGIGTELYRLLEQALSIHNPISYRVHICADSSTVTRLKNYGYIEVKRHLHFRLSLKDFDVKHLKRLEQPISEDIRFSNFTELYASERYRRGFCDFFNIVRLDVPRSEAVTPWSYTNMQNYMFEAPDYRSESHFVAMVDGDFIGTAQLFHSDSSNDFYTGLTAVRREYRYQGIAQQLKLWGIRYALEQGIDAIYTENDSYSIEMLAINDKYGFVRQPAWLTLIKNL